MIELKNIAICINTQSMCADFARKVPDCPEEIMEKNIEKWFSF